MDGGERSTGARERGLDVELRVRDLVRALDFAREVLGARVVSSGAGVAVLRAGASQWTLRADGEKDPLREIAALVVRRGAGIALHVAVADPSAAEARARELGGSVVAPRHVSDRDGYVWVLEGPERA